MVILYIFLFVISLAIGSFLNVLIYRLSHNLPITGRSFCPKCKKTIRWYNNIPLFSFVILGGKCRSCHSPIGWQYPVVELLTGALFVLTVFILPDQGIRYQVLGIRYFILVVYYLFMVSSLIVVFFTDLKYGIIPDKITYPAIAVSLIYIILNTKYLILPYLLSAVGACAFLGLLHLVTRGRGMGLGDVKLAFLMGLFLGFSKIVVAFYLAFLTGAAISLILVLVGKKKFGQTVPFGPFLVTGTLMAMFWGEKIVQLFNNLAI